MIYLDHAATTPVHEDVLKKMYEVEKESFGNPSSVHGYGRKSRKFLDDARKFLADSINAEEREIIFTSGGTEANNLAIIGTAIENEYNGSHIITSTQEHHAIMNIMKYLQRKGFHVTYLPVDRIGQVDVRDVEKVLSDQTILVSVMTANNETGAIQPIQQIGELLKDHQAYFHTDAVQAYSLVDIDVKEMGIDLLTTSAHKLNGPKGIGFLYKNDDIVIEPQIFGGDQERKRRAGTENLIGAVGFHEAYKIASAHRRENYAHYVHLRQLFIQTLEKEEVEFDVNGDINNSIPTIVNISFPGTKIDSLLTNLDLSGVAASSGSACTAGTIEPSHVLKAMYGFKSDRMDNSLRFSFGTANNEENVVEAAKIIANTVKKLKGL